MQLSNEQKQIIAGKICPYCKRSSEYVDSSVVFGKSFGMIYFCGPCWAWCGVHSGTDIALGRLANAELRALKQQAHEKFDQLWEEKFMSRKKAYKWLSQALNIDPEYTHIGMFGPETCKKVIHLSTHLLCQKKKKNFQP